MSLSFIVLIYSMGKPLPESAAEKVEGKKNVLPATSGSARKASPPDLSQVYSDWKRRRVSSSPLTHETECAVPVFLSIQM